MNLFTHRRLSAAALFCILGARMSTDSICRLEPLEQRIAPAGVVTVTFEKGVLTLTGGDGGHVVAVTALDATTFELSGNVDTSFQIGSDPAQQRLRFTSALKSVTAEFGSGQDFISFNNLSIAGDLTIDLGGGDNHLSIGSLSVRGELLVTAGTGADTVILGEGMTTLKKSARFNLDAGDNSVSVYAATLKVGGDFVVNALAGVDIAQFLGGPVAIAGNATFTLGDGRIFTDGPRFTVGKTLTVDNSASAGGLFPSVGMFLGLGGDGIGSDGGLVIVNGNVVYRGGAGDDWISASVQTKVKGTISLMTGAGGALVELHGPGLAAGRIEIDASASSALNLTGQLYRLAVPKGIQVLGGAGADTLDLDVYSGSSGLVDLQLAGGANETSLRFLNTKIAAITATSGADTDEFTLELSSSVVAKNVEIHAGDGSSNISFGGQDATIGGTVRVENGTRAGGSVILGFGPIMGYSASFKVGGVVFAPGDGGPSALHVSARELIVKGALTYLGGDGNDAFNVPNGMNIRAGKGFDFALGEGNNAVDADIRDLSAPSFKMTGGSGNDFLEFFGSGSFGAVTLDLGAGENTARITRVSGERLTLKTLSFDSTSLVGQADSFRLVGAQLTGNLTARFGASASTVEIDNASIGGLLDVSTGAGADVVRLDAAISSVAVVLAKAAVIDLGEDNDQLQIGGGNGDSAVVIMRSTFRADGGNGTDTLVNPTTYVFKKEPELIGFE